MHQCAYQPITDNYSGKLFKINMGVFHLMTLVDINITVILSL